MNNEILQKWLKSFLKKNLDVSFDIVHISIKVTYNRRTLSLKSHDIEINPKQYEHYGEDAVVKIILHELCHYHLHISGKGYQHKDQDFKRLSQQVGAPRFCNSIESYQQRANYEYYCTKCHAKYIRIRKVDTNRMRCGHCNGKLRMKRQLK